MKALVLFCLLLLTTARLSFAAEQVLSSITVGEIPEGEGLFLGRRIAFWVNAGDPVPEPILFQSRAELFQMSPKDFPGPRFIQGEMWIKLTLVNNGSQAVPIVVESRYPLTDFLSFFEQDQNGLSLAQHQGDRYLQPRRAEYFRSPAFKTKLLPGTHDFYLRTNSDGPNLLSLYLWRAEAFEQHKFTDTLVLGCLFGFLLALLFCNGFLAISFRSRTYTLYSVFLLLMILVQISMQNMWPYVLDPKSASWLANEGYISLAMLTNCIGLYLTMIFLNMKKNLPRTRWVFYGLLFLSLVPIVLLFAVPFQTLTRLVSLNIGISAVGMISASLMTIAKGYRPAAYYLIASLSLLAVNLLIALNITGLYHSPGIIQFGNFFGIVMEGLQMSFAIADRVQFARRNSERKILQLNQELQMHLTQVEALVNERTNTIRTILDNVASGLIIVDRDGKVVEGFSRNCRQLLDHDLKVGQTFSAILQLSLSSRKLWDLAWNQIFQGSLPLNVSLSQLPVEILQGRRHLKLEAKALFDEAGSIMSILLTIQDISALKRKQVESLRNRRLIKILGDLEAFRQFISHSFEIIVRLRNCSEPRERSFLLHTLKGNCLVFGLKAIAKHLHSLEDLPQPPPEQIEKLEGMFQKFLLDHESILKTTWGLSQPESGLTRPQLGQLESMISQSHDPQLKQRVNVWIQELMQKSVQTLMNPILVNCQAMAKKLQKPVKIELVGGEVRLQSKQEEFLIELVIHMIRNALVHGLESDRALLGKSPTSLIQIEFKVEKEGLAVSCSDDGQGFDRQQWEAQARARLGLNHEEIQSLSWTDLIRRVSQGGYSTQTAVTLLAGRGVGLEGIFHTVDELGGRIQVESQAGKGCRFQIVLPRGHQDMALAS